MIAPNGISIAAIDAAKKIQAIGDGPDRTSLNRSRRIGFNAVSVDRARDPLISITTTRNRFELSTTIDTPSAEFS